MKAGNNIKITGHSMLKADEKWELGLIDMAVTAAKEAIENSGNILPQVLICANALGAAMMDQRNLAVHVAGQLGLHDIETLDINCGEASGGAALRQGSAIIKAGLAETVLVVGAEKTSDALPEQLESIRAFGLNASLEAHFGFSPSIGAALGMKAYLKRYNLEHSMFYHLARTAHEHAVNNPYAIFPFKLNESQYLKSPVISTPLTVMDTAPPCDGAAAVMLVKEDLNSENKNKGIYILSSSSITGKLGIPLPVETLELPAVKKSIQESLTCANLNIEDIALFEFHDSNSFFSALSIESAGLSKKGEVLKDAADGKFLKDGNYPLWYSGGNKARGNTIGATGIYQAVEACKTLMENSFSDGKKNALIQSLGSFGAQAITHIIGKL